MDHFEIEIKSLLGAAEQADVLRDKLRSLGATLSASGSQRNHYFVVGDTTVLCGALEPLLDATHQARLRTILLEGKGHSIRTREAEDGSVIFVVKASIGDDTSANGVSRMEFEVALPLTLDALDALVLGSGAHYQAKWSRTRESYRIDNLTITLDRNAGYGWVAEFERLVRSAAEADFARREITALMGQLGVEELLQDRLERMFAYYNAHWQEYYGTDRVFTID